MFRITLPLLFLFFNCYLACAQDLLSQEQQLLRQFEHTRNSAIEAGGYTVSSSDSLNRLADTFRTNLQQLLLKKETQGYGFDSLKKYVTVVTSPDQQLRLFSWEQPWNADWHDMTSLAQLMTPQQAVFVQQLNADKEADPFANIRYREISVVEINGQKCYLALGGGMHGSGSHYVVADLFKIKNDKLENISSCFVSSTQASDRMVIEVPAALDTELEYDTEKKEIVYTESFYNEAEQKRQERKKIRWKLENNVFVGR